MSFPGLGALRAGSITRSDWKTMRRGSRVDAPVAETAAAPRRSGQKKPTWMPRARRVRSDLPVRYRGKNLTTWYEGKIQNISQSGVLFEGPQQLPANALVELIFEMPEEISGQKDRNVLCQGRLIRINAPENEPADKPGEEENPESCGLVASILDYKFLHKQ
jgi:hypothetical protein